MQLIDTHAHLDFPDFEGDIDDVVARAREAGVARIITIGTDPASSRRAIALAERFDGVFAAVGLHPSEAQDASGDWIGELQSLAAHPKVVAIGETEAGIAPLANDGQAAARRVLVPGGHECRDLERAVLRHLGPVVEPRLVAHEYGTVEGAEEAAVPRAIGAFR